MTASNVVLACFRHVISALHVLPIAAFLVELPSDDEKDNLRIALPLSRFDGVVGGVGAIVTSMGSSSQDEVEERVDGVATRALSKLGALRRGVENIFQNLDLLVAAISKIYVPPFKPFVGNSHKSEYTS
jgi:hypothetical protein